MEETRINDNEKIGKRIKEQRKARKLTQVELAERIHRTESSIRKYESGLVEAPRSVLENISSVLETSINYLLFGQDRESGVLEIREIIEEMQEKAEKIRQIESEIQDLNGRLQKTLLQILGKIPTFDTL